MRSNSFVGLLIVGLALVIGCSEDPEVRPYVYTKLITGENSKTWSIKFFEETLNGKVVDNFMPPCLTDDRFRFYANTEHSYETTSGTRLCFTNEAPLTSSTWTFTNADATLFMVLPIFSESSIPVFVRELDADDMEIEIFLDDDNTESYRIHFDMVSEE